MIRALKSSGLQVAAVKIELLCESRVRKDECTEIKERARESPAGSRRVCRVCDGRPAEVPYGGLLSGSSFQNAETLAPYHLNMHYPLKLISLIMLCAVGRTFTTPVRCCSFNRCRVLWEEL